MVSPSVFILPLGCFCFVLFCFFGGGEMGRKEFAFAAGSILAGVRGGVRDEWGAACSYIYIYYIILVVYTIRHLFI